MRYIDVERIFAKRETDRKPRRLADAFESGKSLRIQVNGNLLLVPAGARIDIELERDRREIGAVEIEIKWELTKYGN